MNISEKSAHLKGLMEGMDYDLTTKEGKLFAAIADLLEDIALSVIDLEDEAAVLGDYIEEIDEDLGEVERVVYDVDDDDYDDDECDCDCCCEDGDCLELTCPACGELLYLDYDEFEDKDTVECPSCGKVLSVIKDDEDETEE
ncbi:MAG: hypothetical protein CVU97_02855 [Firmicutes bacterium HGW-Firmicutes-21]|nr:MAG: hypothetical protein CVU97_02855 [Firmicutes bacterium HGW-Firmicutes-21]